MFFMSMTETSPSDISLSPSYSLNRVSKHQNHFEAIDIVKLPVISVANTSDGYSVLFFGESWERAELSKI